MRDDGRGGRGGLDLFGVCLDLQWAGQVGGDWGVVRGDEEREHVLEGHGDPRRGGAAGRDRWEVGGSHNRDPLLRGGGDSKREEITRWEGPRGR